MATIAVPQATTRRVAGGSFLIEDLKPADVYTPEDFSDEQRQIAVPGEDVVRTHRAVRAR